LISNKSLLVSKDQHHWNFHVWIGICNDQIIDPHFTINGAIYLDFPQNHLPIYFDISLVAMKYVSGPTIRSCQASVVNKRLRLTSRDLFAPPIHGWM